MVEITLWMKLTIAAIILVVGYFILRYYEMDPIVGLWNAVSQMEWNPTALVLTLMFSALLWAIIWKSPMWVDSTAFGTPSKIFLTIATPIVGYPLAARALNK